MPDVVLQHIVKKYDGASEPTIRDLNLTIPDGEFICLLGPSGCGKTTTLRMIAGLEHPTGGKITYGDKVFSDVAAGLFVPAEKRDLGMMFQSYALWPHKTVFDNVAYGLKLRKMGSTEIAARIKEVLTQLGLGHLGERYPHQLSGGQQQRVAIARALVYNPPVILLDEPLSNLDAKLREEARAFLRELIVRLGLSALMVTHDQGEAMSLSDRIAVMKLGKIEQLGTPAEIYEAPRSSFVAAFIGDTNFFDGIVAEPLDKAYILEGLLSVAVDKDYSRLKIEDFPDLECYNDKQIKEGEHIFLSIRPEKLRISRERPEPAPHLNVIEGIVEDVIYLGSQTKYWVRTGDYRISVIRQHSRYLLDERPIRWRESVWISWHADDGFMLEKYSEQDENLIQLPPEEVGETTEGNQILVRQTEAGAPAAAGAQGR